MTWYRHVFYENKVEYQAQYLCQCTPTDDKTDEYWVCMWQDSEKALQLKCAYVLFNASLHVSTRMCGNLLRTVVQYIIEHSFIKQDVSHHHQTHLTAARLPVFNRQIEKNKTKPSFLSLSSLTSLLTEQNFCFLEAFPFYYLVEMKQNHNSGTEVCLELCADCSYHFSIFDI